MADNDVVQSEIDEDEDEEFMSPGEEFRSLYEQCGDIGRRMKQVAQTMQQGGETTAAEILRQVAGEVVEFLGEVIAATGSHLESMGEQIDGSVGGEEEGVSLDDAKMLYRTFVANVKLWNDVKDQALSSQRETIDKIIEMNEDSMKLVVELCGEESLPSMIEEEAQKVSDGAGATN